MSDSNNKMSKKAQRVPGSNINLGQLAELKQDLIFLPTPAHRRAKSKFWARYSGLGDVQNISVTAALDITGEPALRKWWGLPGFREWFLNQDEARERLEYLYMVALDAAENVLLNPDSNDNAKVQMVKVIAHLAGKEPTRQEKFADEDIQNMDRAKLKAYIEKNAPKLLDTLDEDDVALGEKEKSEDEQGT